MKDHIPIVDLFAGPGGLGEGFASLSDAFRILVSVEMSKDAHKTLKLRAFKRELEARGLPVKSYLDYVAGRTQVPYDSSNVDVWGVAEEEALQLELGNADANEVLYSKLDAAGLNEMRDWVLIGGPPCQAYSLVGRARNRGIKGYVPEEDERHYLYREYLKVIQRYRPAVFVMENVKGLMSSTVSGKRIFNGILNDLSSPDEAQNQPSERPGYRIHSLACDDVVFERGDNTEEFLKSYGSRAFVLRSEEYGVPQARHRVFLVGVREDLGLLTLGPLEKADRQRPLKDVLEELPALRSRLSKGDSEGQWQLEVNKQGHRILTEAKEASKHLIVDKLIKQMELIADKKLQAGGSRVPITDRKAADPEDGLLCWLRDGQLEYWLNHETRGHMPSDLGRYLYASSFAEVHGRSPVGMKDFDLPSLAPNHKSWAKGDFADRFRVQCWDKVSRTITSHISKDGHSFIHPDPAQCRSFTVREAARLQTFPDNYFFEGGRTAQFHQVGNAVPPWLARQIAERVLEVLGASDSQTKTNGSKGTTF